MRFWKFVKQEKKDSQKEALSSFEFEEEKDQKKKSMDSFEKENQENSKNLEKESQGKESFGEERSQESSKTFGDENQGKESFEEERSQESSKVSGNESQGKESFEEERNQESSKAFGNESQGKESFEEERSQESSKVSENESQGKESFEEERSRGSSKDLENQSQGNLMNFNMEKQDSTPLEEKTKKETSEENIDQKSFDQETLEKKTEKLKQQKETLKQYKEKQERVEEKKLDKSSSQNSSKSSIEKEETTPHRSKQTNQFLEKLQELPSFKDRNRSDGYAISTDDYTEIPESVIRTLIHKFLNQRFCRKDTDLNIRSNSFEKQKGFYKWEVKDMIVHLETEQITKVFEDKYGYKYANGKNENVPLSFYFDLSGSMSEYTNLLAVLAIELLKKNIKVLIGFNEKVNVQIDKIEKKIDVKEFVKILESAGYSTWNRRSQEEKLIKDARISLQLIGQNLDTYLLSKKAEKCVVFSDFDPRKEILHLSQNINVYWFCFESQFSFFDLENFQGFLYKVQNQKDIADGLIKVNENRFESLCYIKSNKTLKK